MQAGVAVKAHGGYAQPNRLRLRIVEMAEQRSRSGSSKKLSRMVPGSRPADHSASSNLKNEEREIKGEVFRSPVRVRTGQDKERINLDLPRTSQSRQDQQQLSDYHRVVVLDGASRQQTTTKKDRASAWLLKRFRQRNLANGDDKGDNSKGNDGFVENILPSQFHPRVAEPTKRFRAPSGKVIAKPAPAETTHYVEHKSQSNTPEEEPDVASLDPTTHFPSSGTAEARKPRRLEAYDLSKATNFDEKETCRKPPETRDAPSSRDKRLCELKGNALATPPPRTNSGRKPGLFSASLEAFRRRLRLTADKYSDRLNNDNVDRTEEYVIRPEPPANAMGLNPCPPNKSRHGLPAQRPGYPRNIFQPRPSSQAKRIDPKLRQPYLQSSCDKDKDENNNVHCKKEVYNLISNDENINKNSTNNIIGSSTSNDYKDIKRKESVKQHSMPAMAKNKCKVDRMDSQKHQREALVIKELFLERADDYGGAESTSDSLPQVPNTNQPVHHVKTYVVMNNPSGTAWNQTPPIAARRVAPLTEHNLRLHDSLQAMFERRAQRMARYQKRQAQQQQQRQKQLQQQQQQQQPQQEPEQQQQSQTRQQRSLMHHQQRVVQHTDTDNIGGYDSDSSEETASNKRIRRWVMDVTELSTLPLDDGGLEILDLPLTSRSQPELAVGSAIQLENAMNKQSIACC